MDGDFVENRNSGFYLTRSRVPLDCIVREYQKGEIPEAIRLHYPTLSLEQVYGAIAFYLGHRAEVESSIAEREQVENAYGDAHPAPAHLKRKLERAHPVPTQRD